MKSILNFTRLCQLAAVLPTLASAQNVFAHVVVCTSYPDAALDFHTDKVQMGVTGGYTVDKWTSDIKLA